MEALGSHLVQRRRPGFIDDAFVQTLGTDPDQIVALEHAGILVLIGTGLVLHIIYQRSYVLAVAGIGQDLVKVDIQDIR